MIELWLWVGTMYFCALAYLVLTVRYSRINPHRAAVPMANAKFIARLALTNALNYLAFAVIATYCILSYSSLLPDVLVVLQQWWIVEIFIFWNLRTAALIYLGIRNTKVEI